jgi:hypothetical protein
MSCKEMEPLLYLVKEGELDRKEKEEVDRHLASCEECRKLFRSVSQMSRLISQSNFDFPGEHLQETGETVMRRIHPKKFKGLNHYLQTRLWSLARFAAAVLLFFLIFTYGIQESHFYRNRSELRLRMQEENALSGSVSEETDCVAVLARKIKARTRSGFPKTNEEGFNKINEEQLAQYIHQVCGAENADVNSIKKILKQSGLIVNDNAN